MTSRPHFKELLRLQGYPTLALTVLVLGLGSSFTLPYTSLFASAEVGMKPVQLGLFMTLLALSSILVSTFLGALSDRRVNRKTVLLLCVACAIPAFIGFAFVRSFLGLLLIGCTLLSVGGSAFSQLFAYSRASLGGQTGPTADLAVTTLRTVFSLAWVVGPAMGAVLLGFTGYTGLYLGAAATNLGVGALALRFRRPPDPVPKPAAQARPVALLRDVKIVSTVVSFTLSGMAAAMTSTMLPLYVVQVLHGSKTDVGLLAGLAAALEIPMMLALGLYASRLNKALVVAVGAALQLLYFVALLLSHQVWQILPAQVLTAAYVAVFGGLGISYFQELLPDQPGSATALLMNCTRVGSVLSGAVSGAVLASAGFGALFGLCGLLAALSCALLLLGQWRAQRPARSGASA